MQKSNLKKSPIGITSDCLKFLKSQTTEVILFYSGGKDSVTLLDILSKAGFKIHCVFLYFVKDLEHIEKYMTYAKSKYGVEIIQYPVAGLAEYINDGFYALHKSEKIPVIKTEDIENAARDYFKCEWVITGAKASDSMVRNFMMKSYLLNSICLGSKHAYPLSAWKKGDVLAYMKLNRLPMPIDYGLKNKSSGMTIKKEILVYLQKNYPKDLKKVLEVFPLAEVLLKESEDGKEQNIEVSKIRGSNNK